MSLQKSILLTLAVLQFIANIHGLEMKNFTNKILGTDAIDSALMRYPEGKNNALPHWKCEKVGRTQANCELSLEIYNSDGSVTKKFCRNKIESETDLTSVKLQKNVDYKVGVSYLKSLEMGDDKIEGHYKFRIIDASDCSFKEYDIINEISLLDFLINRYNSFGIELYEDGTFDLYDPNSKACSGSKCITKYDAAGKIISGPKSFIHRGLESEDAIVRMVHSNVARGNEYYVDMTRDFEGPFTSVQLFHTILDGRTKKLLTLDDVKLGNNYDVDGTEGYLTVCSSEYDSKIRCRQFDEHGVIRMNLNVSTFGKVNDIEIQNLEKGDFLLLNSECQSSIKDICKMDEDYYLRHIQADGRVGDAVKLTNLNCPEAAAFKDTRIWLTKDDYVCVSAICLRGLAADVAGSCMPRHDLIFRSNEVKIN